MTSSQANGIRPEDEVTRLCAELIRIPSVNVGDNQGPGERAGSGPRVAVRGQRMAVAPRYGVGFA